MPEGKVNLRTNSTVANARASPGLTLAYLGISTDGSWRYASVTFLGGLYVSTK
jgi:hypothetical protein